MSDQRDTVDAVRRLDPVDGARAAAEWSSSDASSALLQEITAMPVESPQHHVARPRSTPRRVGAVAATLAVAVLAVALTGLLPEVGTPAYAVRHLPGGLLEVSWDGELDGDVLAATLRAYDIEVQVESEPTSPSQVGKVAGLGPLEAQGAAAFEWGEATSTFTLDPAAFVGTFYVLVSRAAEPGERYAATVDAFAPGEILHGFPCAVERPMRTDALAARLDALGQQAVWNVTSDGPFDGEVPQGEVLHAFAVDPSTVEVTVRLDNDQSTADASPYLTPGPDGGCRRLPVG